jgi:eukaryotic-like serine/threonine-protein kinase
MEIQLEPDGRPRTLSAGDRLGRFEIVGGLGAGGMGDVYRARDTQLRREVAIKVLPTAFVGDADRQRRFEREARAAAGLNHPNVVAVHDAGVHDGIPFIVTELLDGETLRQRMNGRPLPPQKAVEYAAQVAAGLAAGHDKGIVHRDIKPENLFVTKDGRVKILDFGLAKTIDPESTDDATLTVAIDGLAVAPVMGTAAYMSPEQARGLKIDHRSDIFSAGAVLYEMLAGFAPFRRGTRSETVSAVLYEDAPPLTRVTGVAPALDRIARHCLEKAPEERFQNVRDLMFDLQALSHPAVAAEPQPRRLRLPRGYSWVLALVAVGAAGYLAGQWTRGPQALPSVHRALPLTDLAGLEESPAISPDRRAVAFTASVDGRRQVFVRLLAGGSPVPITRDSAEHSLPRWSPDGNLLLYYSPAVPGEAQGAIWSIPALGGSPRRIIASISDADVSATGRIACFRLVGSEVQLVTSRLDGSDIQVVARSIPDYHRNPRWSHDGKWIAFERGDGLRYDIFIIPSAGGEARKLTPDRNIINGLAWLPGDRGIVYASSRGNTIPYLPALSLWTVDLDGGTPRQLTSSDMSYEQPDVHSDGLVAAARVRMRCDIWRFPVGVAPSDAVARAVPVTRQTGQVLTPTSDPEGSEIAFLSDSGGHANLWAKATRTGDLRQITFETDPAVAVGVPVWSPDGSSIAFVSSKGRTGLEFGIWLVNRDGTNPRNLAPRGLGPAWSEDGRWLYYAEGAGGVLKKVAASGGDATTVRSEKIRNVIGLHGTTLYYVVERPIVDGRPEFEIRAASPDNGPSRALARVASSRIPAWQVVNPALSPDGEWLAMPLTDGLTTNIWTVSTRTGAWRQITDFGARTTFIARRVSWSPDGTILASVCDGDSDILLLEGLVNGR